MRKGIHGSYSGKSWKRIVKHMKLILIENPKYLGAKKFYVLPISKRSYPRFHIRAEVSKNEYKRGKKVFVTIHIDWKKHIDSSDKDPLITELINKMVKASKLSLIKDTNETPQ